MPPAFFVAAVFAIALSGCASLGPDGSPGTAADAGNDDFVTSRPRVDSRDELIVVFTPGKVELDFRLSIMANEAQIFTAIYEGLFTYHPATALPVPALAEDWNISPDGSEWTFTINRDARFSNGDRITSDDFRRSWLSLLEPEREAPYSNLFDVIEGARDFRLGLATDPSGVGISAPDPRTLVVKLNAPTVFFPSMLCHHAFSPIHASMVDSQDWSGPGHVSSGAFRLAEINESRIVLEKNEFYWSAVDVVLSRIVVRFADDDEASALWNSGEALWIHGNVNFDTLVDHSGISVHALFGTHFYFLRSGEAPFDDYRVRRALALALPWDDIRAGYFLPTRTLVGSLAGYPRVAGIGDGDLAQARRLLALAGFPDGEGMPEIIFRITPSQDAARIVSMMGDAWLENLGVSSRIEVVPYDEYIDSLNLDGYHVGSMSWIGNFPDPYSFLKLWRADSNLNVARLSDDDYEELMERSMFEQGAERLATLAEAEQLLLERGVIMPITFLPSVNVIDRQELEGWFPSALGIHPFRYLGFREFRPLPNVAGAFFR